MKEKLQKYNIFLICAAIISASIISFYTYNFFLATIFLVIMLFIILYETMSKTLCEFLKLSPCSSNPYASTRFSSLLT